MSLLKNAKDTPDDYYTINNFRNELKLIFSSNNYLKKENNKFSKIKYNNNQYKLSFLRKNNSNLNNNEYNTKNDEDKEIIQLESNNKKMENEELKFCLNSIIKIFDKKLYKYSKISNKYKLMYMFLYLFGILEHFYFLAKFFNFTLEI